MQANELAGKKFGEITVIRRVENDKYGKTRWLCRCSCGKEWEVASGNVKHIKSCRKCAYENPKQKHGDSNTRLYRIYQGMLNRCKNKTNYSYLHYGYRGISVCKEWDNDYLFFKQWAIQNGYDDTKSIERIDVNGDYEPNNCKWIDRKEQVHNRTNSRRYEINGKIQDAAQWARESGVNYYTLLSRLDRGIEIKNALEWESKE